MKTLVNKVKARVSELTEELEYQRREQKVAPAKYRELLIRRLISSIESGQEFIFHADEPQGKIH